MIYFTSDSHFWHENIIRYSERPFKDIHHMNETLIARWNEKVKNSDFIFHLGDFSLAHRPVELFLPRLNGHKILIAGNHDHCHPAHYKNNTEKGERMRKFYIDNGFADVKLEGGPITIAGQKCLMHHMPYAGGEGDNHQKYRIQDNGEWLLHGHCHTAWTLHKKMINVGVDVHNFYPISIDEIAEIIKRNPNGWP